MIEPSHLRKIRSFVRRDGRMTASQQRGLELYADKYVLHSSDGVVDFASVFGNAAPVVMEIGFGMGHSLLQMAGEHPDVNFLGVEVHRPGVGRLLDGVAKAELTNVRVYMEDVVHVLENSIPDSSLSAVLIFFPDPWHKKRHHKRRLIQPDFLTLLLRKLKHGAYLHIATDWQNYAARIQEVVNVVPGFSSDGEADILPRRETKFERRGQRLGHEIWDGIYYACKHGATV